jgi:hypothetical protein
MANIEVTHESISVEIETAGIQGGEGPPGGFDDIVITTGAPGTDATANISGDKPNQTLELTIPKGDPGGWVNTTVIGNAVDLNTITAAGTYYNGSGLGTTALNYPATGYAGYLEVITSNASTTLLQRFTGVSTGSGSSAYHRRVYTRTRNGGTWDAWVSIDARSLEDHIANSDPHTQYQLESAAATDNYIARGTVMASGGTDFAFTPGPPHKIYWSGPITIMQNTRNGFSGGFYSLTPPPPGTVITGVGVADQTVASDGIPLPANWHSLYYVLPIGSGSTSQNSNWRIVTYTNGTTDLPSNWVLVAQHNADTGVVNWITGIISNPGTRSNYRDFQTGTGFPEGVVVGTVGARYVDRNATNGATEWVKVSGHFTNTGWKPVYADTGWRDITTTAVSADWNNVLSSTNNLLVRRQNDTVTLKGTINRVSAGDRQGYAELLTTALPTGFRPGAYGFTSGAAKINLTTAPWRMPGSVTVNTIGGVQLNGDTGNWVANDRVFFLVDYPTDNPWPATLPGIAG